MNDRTHDEAFRDYEARLDRLAREHQARLRRIGRTELLVKILIIISLFLPFLFLLQSA